MGSIVSPSTASAGRGIHGTCSLVFLFRAGGVGELLGAVPVRTRGHEPAGGRSLSRGGSRCREGRSRSGFERVDSNRSRGGRTPPNCRGLGVRILVTFSSEATRRRRTETGPGGASSLIARHDRGGPSGGRTGAENSLMTSTSSCRCSTASSNSSKVVECMVNTPGREYTAGPLAAKRNCLVRDSGPTLSR